MTVVLAAARKLRWYVRELTGEARWDDYLAECAAFDEEPMSRRAFERLRDDEREHLPGEGRCC
jgi:uncharacterized short protein YbdD (DUF466 family)